MTDGRQLKTELYADISDYEAKMRRAADGMDAFADHVQRAGRDARTALDRDVGDAADDVGDNLRDAGAEIGDEFAENIGEGFRSGNLGDSLIETLTSLTGNLKGVGGVFAALGAGLVGGLINGFIQRQQELRDIALAAGESIAGAMADGLKRGELRTAIVDIVKEAGGEGSLSVLDEDLRKVGSSMDEYIATVAAGGDTLADYDKYLLQVIRSNTEYTTRNGRTTASLNETATAAQALRRGLREQRGAYDDARSEARAYTDALDGAKGSNDDAGRKIDATSDKIDRQARRFAEARRQAALYEDFLNSIDVSGINLDLGIPLAPEYLPGAKPWRKRRGHKRG